MTSSITNFYVVLTKCHHWHDQCDGTWHAPTAISSFHFPFDGIGLFRRYPSHPHSRHNSVAPRDEALCNGVEWLWSHAFGSASYSSRSCMAAATFPVSENDMLNKAPSNGVSPLLSHELISALCSNSDSSFPKRAATCSSVQPSVSRT